MKGRNVLRLNEATLIEAMQEYLDRRAVVPKDRVQSVNFSNGDFVVVVEEADAPATP